MIPSGPFDVRPHAEDYFLELVRLLRDYDLRRLVIEELSGLAEAVRGDGTFVRYILDRQWGVRHQAFYDLGLKDPNGDRADVDESASNADEDGVATRANDLVTERRGFGPEDAPE